MILEIFLLILFAAFCVFRSEKEILLLIFFILPVHGSLKYLVFHGGGEIFAVWKEMGVIFLLYKTRNIQNSFLKSLYPIYFLLIIILGIYATIGFFHGYSITATTKKIFFPFLLTVSTAKIQFNKRDIKNLFFSIFIGSILINFTALVDFLSPAYRRIFRDLMGATYEVAGDGTVYYDNPSMSIMGYERVAGLMAGGPNQVGVFNSGICILGLFCLIYFKNIYFGSKKVVWFFIALALSFFSLITSFSRAGWVMVIMTFLILLKLNPHLRQKGVRLLLLFGCIVFMLLIFSPMFYDIVFSSITGKEASAGARGSMTVDALNYLVENPLGKGLGATEIGHYNINSGLYFAESSMINFGIEIGIFGVLILCFLLWTICKRIYGNVSRNAFAEFGLGFVIAYSITSIVSVNTFENPFVYYAWLFFGLSLNKIIFRRKPII